MPSTWSARFFFQFVRYWHKEKDRKKETDACSSSRRRSHSPLHMVSILPVLVCLQKQNKRLKQREPTIPPRPLRLPLYYVVLQALLASRPLLTPMDPLRSLGRTRQVMPTAGPYDVRRAYCQPTTVKAQPNFKLRSLGPTYSRVPGTAESTPPRPPPLPPPGRKCTLTHLVGTQSSRIVEALGQGQDGPDGVDPHNDYIGTFLLPRATRASDSKRG